MQVNKILPSKQKAIKNYESIVKAHTGSCFVALSEKKEMLFISKLPKVIQ